MNQILNSYNEFEQNNDIIEIEYDKKIHSKYVFFLRWQFILSIIILVISISYFIISYYKNNDDVSRQLLNNRNIASLYDQNYIASPVYSSNNNTFEVIGIISIEKINITYPILSHMNDELLKIAPCKFYGSNPNQVGNLCIAGHNFNNSTFFSDLPKLELDDIITIYDNYSTVLQYKVYYIDEVNNSDVSCTSQDTNGKKEVTLVTCNNINKKRIIIKAREV